MKTPNLGRVHPEAAAQTEELMDAGDVSAYLHLCKKTVYNLARQGLLPASRVGKSFRFYRSEIDNILKRSTQTKPHILVIEATAGMRNLIKDALEQDGCLVSVAGSCTRAIECLEDIKFEHILLDLSMPDMEGLETLRRIRLADKSVPVTVMAESLTSDDATDAMGYGVSSILKKPFEIQDLLAAVNKYEINRLTRTGSVHSTNPLKGVQVAILAGGMATRLGAIARKQPKCMIRFSDRPFLQYQLELLKQNGINRVLLCLGFLGEQIEDYFKDGAKLGMQISYSYEKRPLGTAGALKNAEELLCDQFFTLYGDSYIFLDFSSVWNYFQAKDKMALMTVYKNEDRYDTSNTTLRGELVASYDKKKQSEDMRHIEYGVNLFRKEVLSQIPADTFYGLEDLFPRLIDSKQLLAYEVPERFYEIGSPGGLDEFSSYIGAQK